jgi:large subunit ribosomal protein L30
MVRIAITLRKSTIGFPRNQRRIVAGLGLRRLHQTVVHEDSATIRGMVDKVPHLLEVAEASAETD